MTNVTLELLSTRLLYIDFIDTKNLTFNTIPPQKRFKLMQCNHVLQ